ncbi:hypothetical protein ACWA9T_001924 [Klebsiella pneumoniae]|uniref:hypothetical protein n=1 Tax=Klebsiella sp. C408 TaxID=3409950 RepID=UPI0027F1B543|nr:hypothetical protein [Klebsiella pneumoniae]EKY7549462.1 hypothetical protein [Klebsiella pneumoniae]HBQ0188231.1 hypothetical protein [Klebsiella pneumoniae]HBT7063286.1 hypothetical protein [Klebsiella pneumoniae]HBW1318519.1 hypothetical protein [Klebsiella pneumoniae]
MTMWQKSAAICAAVITKPTSQKAMTAMKPVTKLSVKSAVSKALIRTALTTAARITLMTDITELAQREKFEAWFKSSFHPDKTGPYIKDQLYFAWKAAGAELVEALEKTQHRIAELESRTVKLPKLKMLEDYLAEVAIEERKQILVGVKLEFHRALAAAGIKVEAE